MRKDITELVDKTISSLDGINRAEAPGYFLAKTKAKLYRSEQKEERFQFRRPVLLIAVLTLFLIMNSLVLLHVQSNSRYTHTDKASYVDGFAKEYGFTTSDY